MDEDEVSEIFEDIEDQNFVSYDRQEKNDRQNFIDMFKDNHSYLNANNIADLKNFYHGNGQKYMLCMCIILYIENFLKIKKNQDHHLKN